jgi:soluble lytic murein transglycosylase-like protein
VLEPYRRWIEESAAVNGLKPSLLAALLLQESRGNPAATRYEDKATWVLRSAALNPARKAGWSDRELMTSYGLGQVMGSTAWSLGYRGKPSGLLEPKTSVEYAARYLGRRLREHKTPLLALVAYNGGIGAVRVVRAGGEHQAAHYARRVLEREASLVASDFSRAMA